MSASLRQALLLAGVVVTATLALTAIDRLTREPIARSRELAADAALRHLVPALATDPKLEVDAIPIPPQYRLGLGLTAPERVRRLSRGVGEPGEPGGIMCAEVLSIHLAESLAYVVEGRGLRSADLPLHHTHGRRRDGHTQTGCRGSRGARRPHRLPARRRC